MIHQPERDSRDANDLFYETEKCRIEKLNKVLGDVELTKGEEKSLVWLAGWEESTLENIISAFTKAKGIS